MKSTPAAANFPSPCQLSTVISVGFLGMIFAFPLIQFTSELPAIRKEWPTAWQLLPALQRAWSTPVPHGSTPIRRLMAINDQLCRELRSYEKTVTATAWLVRAPRDGLQAVMSHSLRSGNDQVVVGRDGWLFFRPDVDALTGRGFLQPMITRAGIVAAPREANPLPAIRRFAADLQARGIQLLIVPIPSKAALLGSIGSTADQEPPPAPVHNASFDQLLTELKRDQIAVADLTATLLPKGTAVQSITYLKTDSHWSPAGLRDTTSVLAARVTDLLPGLTKAQKTSVIVRQEVENHGDTARLLSQDSATETMPPERCQIDRVLSASGAVWQPDPQAAILLLGDSFTNIYSQRELGWGDSAGLAEQLSQVLHVPLDRIALNAGGALAARTELVRQLQTGLDRLAGKKLVIWQFAERELSSGDWRILPLPASAKSPPEQKTPGEHVPAATMELIVTGRIQQIGHLPDPARLPYREALLPIHLNTVSGVSQGTVPDEIVVYVWGLRDRKLTPMASWKAGQTVRVKLIPWTQAERQYGQFARAELDDPDFRLIDLPTYWGAP